MSSDKRAPALDVQKVSVFFGGLAALSNVDLQVQPGTRHGILGANGAGKTTLFNVITGFIFPNTGSVSAFGQIITRLPPHRRVHLGLARTFQITTLFKDLTALENVLMGALVTANHHRDVWRPARQDREARDMAESFLQDLDLAHFMHTPVSEIGYGEQRLLEIAVTSALEPRILLLDEPTAGLSAAETSAVLDLIARLPRDLTVVIIEHDLDVIFEVAEHLTVLHFGERIADGPADTIRQDPIVKEVYLGSR
jgi:branched-chain amino acid transport system ATP-binding protein